MKAAQLRLKTKQNPYNNIFVNAILARAAFKRGLAKFRKRVLQVLSPRETVFIKVKP